MQAPSRKFTQLWVTVMTAGFLLQALSLAVLAEQPKFRPGMIIRFKSPTSACFTREALIEYQTYAARRELAKAKSMLMEAGGSKCFTIPSTKKLKIISTEYNPGSEVAILEVAGANVTATHGAWTFSTGALVPGR